MNWKKSEVRWGNERKMKKRGRWREGIGEIGCLVVCAKSSSSDGDFDEQDHYIIFHVWEKEDLCLDCDCIYEGPASGIS